MSRLTPMILAVALFMEQMDSTVIATSLPAIAEDMGTSAVALKLAVTTYMVALAIFIPVSGWMSDRFGARNIFRLAIVVFIVGSIACGISDSIETFVASRFLQGIGGSMMTPVGRLLLVRGTPRNRLVDAMAWLSIPAMLGPIMGPPVGGFITTFFSWHWVFFINVPIGLIGIALVTRFLPAGESRHPRPMDFTGFVLSGIAFSGLVFGFSVISLPALPAYYGWSTLAAGAAAGLLYLPHARRTKFPLLDPAMFRYPMFRTAILGGSIFRLGIGAMPFLLPLMLQIGFGLSPFESGMVTFVGAVGALGSKFLANRIFAAFGFRQVFLVGAFTSSVLIMVNGLFYPGVPVALIMAPLLVGGVLRSTTFTGINAMAFSDVENADQSQATAINSVAQQLSRALGVALAGTILDVSSLSHGGTITIGDFHLAFFIVGAMAACAVFTFMRLPADAGAQVTGHRAAIERE